MIFPLRRRATTRWTGLLAVAAVGLSAAACSPDDRDIAVAESSVTTASGTGDRLDVIASFYPLQFVADQVGGDLVEVTNITPAGAEPHDLELTARDTAAMADSDLVVYLDGFAPALDESVATVGVPALDVAGAAKLDRGDAAHDEHADDEPADDDTALDPHFWLDPRRLADVADVVAERFAELSPDHADAFADNAVALRSQLEALDAEFETGLADCASTDLVTSHEAFGYLAQRYGLTQVGISGLSPDEEPSPGRLAEVTDLVRANDVSTIYFETLVDPSIAETVASETGASTAVLDPLEGLTDGAAGDDYLAVMRANLEVLRAGQDCE